MNRTACVCVWGRRSVNEEGKAADAASRQRLALSREWNLGATKLLQTNSAGGPCPITAWNKRAGAPRGLQLLRRGGGHNEPSSAASERTHSSAQHLSFYLPLAVPNQVTSHNLYRSCRGCERCDACWLICERAASGSCVHAFVRMLSVYTFGLHLCLWSFDVCVSVWQQRGCAR